MKTIVKLTFRAKSAVARIGFIASTLLLASFLSAAVFAGPPATVATCNGIADAYPILGVQCKKAYERIRHVPKTALERSESFDARKHVLVIFRKVLLCNGMFKATNAMQQQFKSGEENHLRAIANLRQSMVNEGDKNVPETFTEDDLFKVAIKQQQCK